MTTNRIYAGDTLEFGLNVPDYPPSAGWTLRQRYVPRFTTPTQLPIDRTATAGPVLVGGVSYDYAITATPATTAGWAPGQYGWHTWVERAGVRVTLEGTQFVGELTVLPDPATATAGVDTRSQAQRALDDARAALAAWTPTYRKHQVGDRAVEFNAVSEIQALVRYWQAEVDKERAIAEGRASGPLGRMLFGVPQ